MTWKPRDRLSAEPGPFYVKDHPMVRVSIDGVEYTGRVMEYCISKGWAKVLRLDAKGEVQRSVRGGRASCTMKHGKIMVWLASDPTPTGAIRPGGESKEVHILPADMGATA